MLRSSILALRPWSLTAMASTLLISFTYSKYIADAEIDIFAVALLFIGGISAQCAGNLTNTFFDFRRGVDTKEHSDDRTFFEVGATVNQVFILMVLFYLITIACGYYLSSIASSIVGNALAFPAVCFVGVLLTYAYTGPPFTLKYRALGDITILACFCILPFNGSILVLTGGFPPLLDVVLFALPVGLLIEAILHANNQRDVIADGRAGITTLAQILGRNGSSMFFKLLLYTPYAIALATGIAERSIAMALFPSLSFPLAVAATTAFTSSHWDGLCAQCGALSFLFGILTSLAIVIHHHTSL